MREGEEGTKLATYHNNANLYSILSSPSSPSLLSPHSSLNGIQTVYVHRAGGRPTFTAVTHFQQIPAALDEDAEKTFLSHYTLTKRNYR